MPKDRTLPKKNIIAFLSFLLLTGIVLVLIKALNWLPMTFQNESLRRYASIEDVKTALHLEHLSVPAYFPQTIAWPPEHILAQSRPFLWVLLKFRERNSSRDALLITQSTVPVPAEELPTGLATIRETADYQLRGRRALLEAGTCEDGEPCSRIRWQDGGFHVMVFMRAAPAELVRLSESMLHEMK